MNLSCFRSIKAGFSVGPSPEVHSWTTLKQTHSDVGRWLEEGDSHEGVEGDWLATQLKGQRIAVKVADCTAALIEGSNARGNFVAAIHAGWRGTAKGILEKCWESLDASGPVTIWLSPSICQMHFQVGEEVLDALGKDARHFSVRDSDPKKFLLDLKGFQISKFKAWVPQGSKIFSSPLCTSCQPDLFSYRRSRGQLNPGERHFAWAELF